MDHHDPLMVGMFWGGLLVASVPILLTLGVGIYVLRRYLESREAGLPGPQVAEGDTGSQDRGGRE
jgi:hypothetical protein